MSKKMQVSSKRSAIDKNNTRIVAATAVASALAVFALVGGYSMLNRMSYQRHVASQQSKALAQLSADQDSLNKLVDQYQIFNSANPNMLGVSSSGSSGDQGTNARIVLDALPSQYDFPALASSIEKILEQRGIPPSGIGGSDQSATISSTPSANPSPQTMTFSFTATTSYDNAKALLQDFERSIRPFKVTNVSISGDNAKLSLSATVNTFYQPPKTLNITSQVVK